MQRLPCGSHAPSLGWRQALRTAHGTGDRALPFANGVAAAVGRTPLIKLKRASEETGCTILGKAEFMNPGQSVKDRAALFIIQDAVKRGTLRPGGTVVEGTAGNTGIGLTVIGNALGFRTVIVIPETQSQEKKDALRLLGAQLVEVPALPYKNPNSYVHYSRAPGRGAGQDRAQRRHLGQPVGQYRQPPGPHRDHGRGDLGRHRRQGRRLRLRRRLRRHARRRLRRPQGQAQATSRSRSPTCPAPRSTATTRRARSRPRAPPSPRASARAASPRTSRAPWSTAPI